MHFATTVTRTWWGKKWKYERRVIDEKKKRGPSLFFHIVLCESNLPRAPESLPPHISITTCLIKGFI